MVEAKVTVLVPVYNVERYIAKCLDSLLEQTFDNFEVWAVSDGSPDNSVDIIKKYCQKDNRIKLIEKENGGYGSVLQYGVQNIKSKYFIICDPDDWLAPTAIEELYVYAEENNLDITVGDRFRVYENDDGTYKIVPENIAGDIPAKKIFTDSLDIQKFANASVTPHAKLFKTEITRNIEFPTHVSFTDFVLYTLSLSNANRIAYYNVPLAYYLLERQGNTRTDTNPRIIDHYIAGWYSIMSQLEKKNIEDYPILLERMLRQIKGILIAYKMATKADFKDEYGRKIIGVMREIQKYKKYIWKYPGANLKTKIIDELLLNRWMGKLGAKLYLNFKKI